MAYIQSQTGNIVTPNTDSLAPQASQSVNASLLALDAGGNYDRLRNVDAFSNALAAPEAGMLSVGMPNKRYPSAQLAAALNSVLEWDVLGDDAISIITQTTATGTFIFEATVDGSNWYSAEARASATDMWMTGVSITPTAGTTYRVFTMGIRKIRMRVNSALGGPLTIVATSSPRVAWVTGVKIGPAPHNIGYTLFHRDGSYTTAQTGVILYTPSSGRRFVITDLTITTGGTTAGVVTLFDSSTTSSVANQIVFQGEFAPSSTVRAGVVKSLRNGYVSAAANNSLRLTSSAAMTLYVQVDGYEIV